MSVVGRRWPGLPQLSLSIIHSALPPPSARVVPGRQSLAPGGGAPPGFGQAAEGRRGWRLGQEWVGVRGGRCSLLSDVRGQALGGSLPCRWSPKGIEDSETGRAVACSLGQVTPESQDLAILPCSVILQDPETPALSPPATASVPSALSCLRINSRSKSAAWLLSVCLSCDPPSLHWAWLWLVPGGPLCPQPALFCVIPGGVGWSSLTFASGEVGELGRCRSQGS